jgi:hypothetical protein
MIASSMELFRMLLFKPVPVNILEFNGYEAALACVLVDAVVYGPYLQE